MQEKLEQYLYKKYPDLFKNESKSVKETCMCWGCECGDGWFFLLDNLCSAIKDHIDSQHNRVEWYDYWNKKNPKIDQILTRPKEFQTKIDPVYFDQVKEKFGSLRIYYTGGDDTIMNMINFAERLSQSICENCGKFDYSVGRTQKGWIRSLCRDCYKIDERGWKQTIPELEELFKLVKNDSEKNKGKEIELSLKKAEQLLLRNKTDDKTKTLC